MNFIAISMFFVFPAALIVIFVLFGHGSARRRKAIAAWLGPDTPERAGHIRLSSAKRAWRLVFLIAGIGFLTVAAARPWWEFSLVNQEDRGRDVLVVFDVSKSMLATDVAPSRLEHGKWMLRELFKAHPSDRFGLLPFAGRALLSCPLTSDRSALAQYLAELDTSAIPVGGTNVAEALRIALQAFQAAEGNDRAIVLFSDGEELSGDVTGVLAELKKRKIPLFVVGLGSTQTGAPIPEVDERGQTVFKRDDAGELIKTKLNEPLLQNLAAQTGGLYVHSTTLDSGLAELNSRISQLTVAGRGEVMQKLPVERFMPFLLAGFVCLLIYWLMDERLRFRRVPAAGLLLGLALLGAPGVKGADGEALAEAPAAPQLIQESTATPLEEYNQAVAAQEAEEIERARKSYEAAISQGAQLPEVRQRAWHNYGVIDHAAGRAIFDEAQKALPQGQLDAVLKQLDRADKQLNQAEESYVNALATPSPSQADTGFAQNALLADRDAIAELRKKIEELKKQQQEAQQQAQQAQQENKEQQEKQQSGEQNQSQEQQSGEQSQSQEQQSGEQSQSQEQQSGEQNQSQEQQSGQSATEQARDSAQQLQQMAESMQQQQMADAAKKAAEQLQEAAEKERSGDYKDAEKNIEAAREALKQAAPPSEQSGKESAKEQSAQGEQGEKSQEEKQGESSEASPESAEEETPLPQASEDVDQSEQEIDEAQADALLDMLTQEETQMREQYRRDRQKRAPFVRQDW